MLSGRTISRTAALLVAATLGLAGCGGTEEPPPPAATPGFTISQTRVPLGRPVTVSPTPPPANDNYRVFVHFLDPDRELMWTDDHDPPIPTSQWKPGQLIENGRTMFVPVYPYLGETMVEMGLYSTSAPAASARLPLIGEEGGERSYRVGTIEMLPQTENVFVIFKDGWHAAETPPDNPAVEWQWTRRDATLSVRNPKRDVIFYLQLDHPGLFKEAQQVNVTIGEQTIDSFSLQPGQELIRKAPVTAAQLGTSDVVDIRIGVDKTYVPALITNGASRDPRELGVRVFHAFVQPRAGPVPATR
jgi:hypothetical protein